MSLERGLYNFGKGRIPFKWPVNVPSDEAISREPNGNLTLSYSHGFNGNTNDSRQNLFVTPCGTRLIYFLATTGVVHNLADNTQKFFTGHNDDITTICMDPNGSELVATGQKDPKDTSGQGKDLPKVYIWNYDTLETHCLLDDICEQRINRVRWSKSGILYVIGGDDGQNTLKAFDSSRFNDGGSPPTMIDVPSAKACPKLIGCVLSPQPQEEFVDEMILYGAGKASYVTFTRSGDELEMVTKGIVTRSVDSAGEKAFTAACFLDDARYLIGGASGKVYLCKGETPLEVFAAHSKAVGDILWDGEFLTTSGADSKIRKLHVSGSDEIEDVSEVEIATPDGEAIVCRVLACHEENMYIGTKNNQVVEVEMKENASRIVIDGHAGDVQAMACHHSRPIYVSGGYDGVIAFWDLNTKQRVRTKAFEPYGELDVCNQIVSLDWSPNGELIAVGTEQSKLYILSYPDLEIIYEEEIRKSANAELEAVQALRFSSDNTLLGVGHMDSNVYVYGINGGEVEKWQPISANTGISHIAMSDDNKWCKVFTRSYEILHFQMSIKKHKLRFNANIPHPDITTWGGKPLIAGWDMQGLLQPEMDGTDVNSVVLSHDNSMACAGDDAGILRLHNYPAIDPEASKPYTGHAEFVQSCAFSFDDGYVVSCGGADQTILEWTCVKGTVNPAHLWTRDPETAARLEEEAKEEGPRSSARGSTLKIRETKPKRKSTPNKKNKKLTPRGSSGGNRRSAPAPRNSLQVREERKNKRRSTYNFGMGQIPLVLPEGAPDGNTEQEMPAGQLTLEYSHGYVGSSDDGRQNLYVTPDGKLIYFAASVGIVHDIETNTQKFFQGHNDDITTICLDPNSSMVATGQKDPKDTAGQGKDLPKIWVWDYDTMQAVCLIDKVCIQKIARIRWSKCSGILYSVGGDSGDATLKAYDSKQFATGGQPRTLINIQTAKACPKLLGMILNPSPQDGNIDEMILFGKGKMSFCELRDDGDKMVMRNRSVITRELFKDGEKAYITGTYLNDGPQYAIGAASGRVYICEGLNALSCIEAHSKPVGALCWNQSGSELITFGGDSKVVTIAHNQLEWEETSSTEINNPITWGPINARTLAYSCESQKLFIGTRSNQILEYELKAEEPTVFLDGHGADVHTMATHPTEPVYLSGGWDGHVKFWDITTKQCVRTYTFPEEMGKIKVASTDWHPSGDFFAVGTEDSRIFIINYESFDIAYHEQIIKTKNSELEAAQYCRWSPQGDLLGVGHMDSNIYVYSFENGETEKFAPISANAGVSQLVFNDNGSWIKAFTRSYEVLHYRVSRKKKKCKFIPQVPNPEDVKWAGNPLIAGWDVQGLLLPEMDGTDLNCCALCHGSDHQDVIVCGDDRGLVRLHTYPSVDQGAHLEYRGHAEFVQMTLFTADDGHVISCGGADRTIFEWKVDLGTWFRAERPAAPRRKSANPRKSSSRRR